ncbi:MAG: BadF/BadG/BcrA/BcrD ATPase family protein [Propionibacteriaceae bacterium]|nr:BadF/BadG/BcrA/BcrD ATPase family protein [Propionibacteriaceae bacterium]
MSDDNAQLVVHAGQSGIRLRLNRPQALETVAPGVSTDRPFPAQWADAIRSFLDDHADAGVTSVAVGASGLGRENAHEVLALLSDTTVRHVVLAHDSVTNYLGALGDGTGCVISGNTGTICLAVGPRDTARVDGWGHLLGDAGSCYWIGRTGLEAALRGHDGRRQMTALTAAMADVFPEPEFAYLDLQSAPDRVARVASFASVVMDLAPTDRVANTILDKAAAHLSEAVQAAVRRVHLGTEAPRVAAIGAVFANAQVVRRFTDFLTLPWPEFALTEPRGDALDGADALLRLPADHPLFGHLSTARR